MYNSAKCWQDKMSWKKPEYWANYIVETTKYL